jgi:hypothetical protein
MKKENRKKYGLTLFNMLPNQVWNDFQLSPAGGRIKEGGVISFNMLPPSNGMTFVILFIFSQIFQPVF